MKQEFSAGVVVYYERGSKREYLLLHYESGHWDFPKGHIEKNESKIQAALRETDEEAGITPKILSGFEYSFVYFFKNPKTGELIHKTVYFYIGKSRSKKVTLSFEHTGFLWLSYKKALEQLTYKNAQELLKKVELFLNAEIN